MVARLTAIVLAAGLLAAGCGHSSGPRAALAGYITHVDEIESALRAPLRAVTRAGDEFAREQRAASSTPKRTVERGREQALLKDAKQIASLRARLAAVTPPPPAAHLRSLLLELTDAQLKLTREVAGMVVYLPQVSVTLSALGPAMRRLVPALAPSHASGATAVRRAYEAKAVALRSFAASLDRILAQLRSLRPPTVSRPGYLAQLSALQGMSTNAERLAKALSSGHAEDVAQILLAFDRASTASQSAGAQRAQIAAVRAYDAQVRALDRISGSIEVERSRLANTVH